MAEIAQTHSVEEKIITAINNTIDFGWIWSSGCLLHHQEIVDGIARGVTRITILCVVQANKQVTDGSNQTEGYKEEDESSVAHESVRLMYNKFLRDVWFTHASQFCMYVNI